MPTLLKIGYDYFVVRNASAAAAAINALAGAVALKRDYDSAERDQWYPEERQPDIGMITVRADQILACKPGASVVEVEPARKQISNSAPRRLCGEKSNP